MRFCLISHRSAALLRAAAAVTTLAASARATPSPAANAVDPGDASERRAEAPAPPTARASDDAKCDDDGSPWEGYYLDPARGPAPFAPEYALWFDGSRRPERYGRAGLELLGVLAVGTSYYWIVSDPNKQDWDYIDIRDRSLHVEVKFDNNMFRTNFLLHPVAGTMSYWLSRANGLDVYRASAASFLSSAAFEFLLEWLEKPSINDLVATPIGGVAAGEFFFHLGDYLNSAFGHDTALQRVLAYSVAAPQGIHSAMDGTRAPIRTRDSLGYTAAYWHEFKVAHGLADIANDRGASGTLQDLVFEAKLVAMPGFLQPGRFRVNFNEGNFTEARLRTSLADGWLKDVDLWFGSDLVGHYRQDFTGSPTSPAGSAAMLAASVDMRYVDRWLLGRRDQFAFFHFLGPSGKFWLGLGHGVMASAEGRFHLDFAGITSPAYPLLVAGHGSEGTKTVLQLQNYYQGVGVSGRIAASIGVAGFQSSGYARYGTYRSIDGLDRFATPIDAMNTDQIIELGAALSFTPPQAPLSLRVAWETLEHRSQMGPYALSYVDRRASASAAIAF